MFSADANDDKMRIGDDPAAWIMRKITTYS